MRLATLSRHFRRPEAVGSARPFRTTDRLDCHVREAKQQIERSQYPLTQAIRDSETVEIPAQIWAQRGIC
jgi:hypothetical protein